MNRGLWNFSLFLLIMGLIWIAAGLVLRAYYRRMQELKGHTRARVVDLVLREFPDSSNAQFSNRYYPVIEFYANGKLFKENYPYGSYPSSFQVGDEVWIDYELSDPHEYEIRKTSLSQAAPNVLYFGGIVMVVTGALLFLVFAARG